MSSTVFKGGIHPDYKKEITVTLAVTAMKTPDKVVIPLQQHIGAPCEPLKSIEVGSQVKKGQMIADSKGFVSAPIHASISGTITAIGPYNHPLGSPVQAITIESDGEDAWDKKIKPLKNTEKLTADDIRSIVRKAGIVGLGGATFPAHVKLSPPPEKKIDIVIINGAECEPYLTADHRVMLEQPEKIVSGLKLMIRALGAEKGIIGIEDNKGDAIRILEQVAAEEDNISVASLHTKYPQGAEKMLIQVITGRKVPAGGLPLDIGVVNHNVGTAVAVNDAVLEGKPLIERVLTVTGAGVTRPANLLVRVGTLVSEVLDSCGGLKDSTLKLIIGGPMMGLAQPSMDIPVIKGTSGILALTDQDVYLAESSPCIRCGKCVDGCPIQLLPTAIAQAAEHQLFKRAEKLHALDCFECGCCAYVCPSKIPLTQWIRIAKAEIMKANKK
jgi:Na+-translocating ferredoxin:NAD+ oxidoreductase subunit C